jgi:hypothetical protein
MGLVGKSIAWQNSLRKVPITTRKELDKKTVDSGFSKVKYPENQVFVAWKDIKGVFMASRKLSSYVSTVTYKRFYSTKRTIFQVPPSPT